MKAVLVFFDGHYRMLCGQLTQLEAIAWKAEAERHGDKAIIVDDDRDLTADEIAHREEVSRG